MLVSLQRSPPSGGDGAFRPLKTAKAGASPNASTFRSAPDLFSVAATVREDRRPDVSRVLVAGAGAASPVSGKAQTFDAGLSSDYQRQLQDHIQPFKRYPDDADRAMVRGVVELSFEIDRQGRLLSVRVAKTSGSASLDEAALDTVRRAAPMPVIPPELPDALSVELPVEFLGAG